MLKNALIAATLIIFGSMILNLGKQIYQSLESSRRLDQAANAVASLQQRQEQLTKQLSYVNSFEFIEISARNKLNMSRPNETVVIIDQQVIDEIIESEKVVTEVKIPNWQGWVKLFWN